MEPKERILSLRILNRVKNNSDYTKYFEVKQKRMEESRHKKRNNEK